MHHDVTPEKRGFAKQLRSNATDAERRLWSILRAGRMGAKFKRQVPLEGYVLDFVAFDAKLIVEVDGGQHAESVSDTRRDLHFAALGYRTLRFWNNDVLSNLDGVHRAINDALRGR